LDQAQKQGSACPWKLPGSRTANTHGSWPFEVERKALRLGPASPQSEPAETGHSSPRRDSPPPQELAALLERDQVSGRISMSAPFRHNADHGSTVSGNVEGVWRVRLSARRRGESLVVTAPSQEVLPPAISLVLDG